MATKQEIISNLNQCGGLSYNDFIDFINSMATNDDLQNTSDLLLALTGVPSTSSSDLFDLLTGTFLRVNKTILVLGTSIPAGGKYWDAAATKLSMKCINNAIGSSPIRIAKADGSTTGMAWQNLCYALAHTIAEKQNIIDNWATIRTTLVGSPPVTLTADDKAYILGCSYGNLLTPYLDGTQPAPDAIIIDHGYNDNFATDTDTDYKTIPALRNNRNYFLGAMNYIVDHILSYKPYMRIIIAGHYENTLKTRISEAQLNFAQTWEFPIVKTWEQTGWSQQIAPNTQQYWSQAPWNLYSTGQDTTQNMTMKRFWLPDDLHPYTDTSGKASALLARIATNALQHYVQ